MTLSPVRRQGLVVGDEPHRLFHGLGEEEAIEGIAVEAGKRSTAAACPMVMSSQ